MTQTLTILNHRNLTVNHKKLKFKIRDVKIFHHQITIEEMVCFKVKEYSQEGKTYAKTVLISMLIISNVTKTLNT